jgi:3D (Asp-Asp-Asp) domain-containing protein
MGKRKKARQGKQSDPLASEAVSALASAQSPEPSVELKSIHNSIRFKPVILAFLTPVIIGLGLSAYRSVGETRNVTVLVDGQAIHFTTRDNFVGEALKSANIEVDNDDLLMPPAMATLMNDEVITIKRVHRETVEREVLVPYETKVLKNARMRFGSEVELRAGSPGIRREVVEIETIDGVVTKENTLSDAIAVKPIDRKIYLGTRTTGSTVSALRMEATAYTAGAESCWPSVDGLTAVMKQAGYGVAAVDPRVVQLGTRLYIEGYGFAVASDVGGAIKGNRIDLFMSDVGTARSFGRRSVNVYLLD